MTQQSAAVDAMRHHRGGALLWVVLAIATLIAVAAVVVFITMRFQGTQEADHRNALRISDEGVQQALMTVQKSPSWSTGLSKTDYLGGWYAVTVALSDTPANPRMTLTSEGHSGSTVIRQIWVLQRLVSGSDTTWTPVSQRQE